MKVTIDMENLEKMVADTCNKNAGKAIQDALESVVREKIDEVLGEKTDEYISHKIEEYIQAYLSTTKIQVGNSWSGDGVKEYTVEEYVKKQISDILSDQKFTRKVDDRWGGRKEETVDFKAYIDSKIDIENEIKPYMEKIARQVRDDVNHRIKSMLDEAMRKNLADNVFTIVSSSETYRKVSESIKLLGQ